MFQPKLPMNIQIKRIIQTKTTTLSIHSSIFPATQNTNAKSITQNFRPVQIDTIEKQCPENSNLKNGLPFCLPHFFNPKKSEEIFYHNQKSMTKNLDKKIRPQKNHQKFFRHFFQAEKKIIRKKTKKNHQAKKLNQIFHGKNNNSPKNFSQKSKAKFSIKISRR